MHLFVVEVFVAEKKPSNSKRGHNTYFARLYCFFLIYWTIENETIGGFIFQSNAPTSETKIDSIKTNKQKDKTKQQKPNKIKKHIPSLHDISQISTREWDSMTSHCKPGDNRGDHFQSCGAEACWPGWKAALKVKERRPRLFSILIYKEDSDHQIFFIMEKKNWKNTD